MSDNCSPLSPAICYQEINGSLSSYNAFVESTQATQSITALTTVNQQSTTSSLAAVQSSGHSNRLSSIFNFGLAQKSALNQNKQIINQPESATCIPPAAERSSSSGCNTLAKSSQFMLLPSMGSSENLSDLRSNNVKHHSVEKSISNSSQMTLQYVQLGRLECKIEEIKSMIAANNQKGKKKSTEKPPKVVHLASVECMTDAVSTSSCGTQTGVVESETVARSYCDAAIQTDQVEEPISTIPSSMSANIMRQPAEIQSSSSESSAVSSNSSEAPGPADMKPIVGQAKRKRFLLDIDLNCMDNLGFMDNHDDSAHMANEGFDNSALLAKIKNKAKRTAASQYPTQV